MKVSDQLRAALRAAPVSRYRIEQEIGIRQSVTSRFVAGKRGLSMETLDSLADFLDLELRPRATKRRGVKR